MSAPDIEPKRRGPAMEFVRALEREADRAVDAKAEKALAELLSEFLGQGADAAPLLGPTVRLSRAILRVVVGAPNEELVEAAEREADREAARSVPTLRRAVVEVDARVGGLAQQTADDVAAIVAAIREQEHERRGDRGRQLIAAAARAGIPAAQLIDKPGAVRAMACAWRAMVATEAEAAVPLLAALAIRYHEREGDGLFRALVRVFADASDVDVEALGVLVAAAARAEDRYGRIQVRPERAGLYLHVDRLQGGREGVTWQADSATEPALLAGGRPIAARSGIVAALLRHGVLADPPAGTSGWAELDWATLKVLRDLFVERG